MKRLSLLLFLLLQVAFLLASERDSLPPISLTAYAKYGYNLTWKSYGELAVSGYFPLHRNFSLQAGADLKTANVYVLDGRATAHFPLKVGELQLENRLNYTAAVRSKNHELCEALSLAYRMDYFSVQLGGLLRFTKQMNAPKSKMIEPAFIYSIEGRVRRDSDFWNLGLRVSNYDEFQIANTNELIFTLMSRYDINNSLRIFADVYIKPAGIFNIAVNFYDAGARVGVRYLFNSKSQAL